MWRHRSAIALAGAVLWALTPAAGTASGVPGPAATLGAVAPGEFHGIVSDGRRWAAWRAGDRDARIFDARSRSVVDVTLPEDCDGPSSTLTAIGGGRLAVKCTDVLGPPHSVLLDLAATRFGGVPGTPRCEDAAYDAIGEQWAHVTCLGSHQPAPYVVRWRTGETRDRDGGRRSATSLDAPSASQPLCSPVRRRRTTRETGLYDPMPLGGWVVSGGRADGTLPYQRCGSSRISGLRCGALCVAARGDGWLLLAWSPRSAIVVRAVPIGRTGPGTPIRFMPDLPFSPGAGFPHIVGTYVLANVNGVVTAWGLPGSAPLSSAP